MSDLISRQQAINSTKYIFENDWMYPESQEKYVLEMLDDLPSAQPDRKKGRWIDDGFQEEWWGEQFTCSICGETMIGMSKYCPECGADMEGLK